MDNLGIYYAWATSTDYILRTIANSEMNSKEINDIVI